MRIRLAILRVREARPIWKPNGYSCPAAWRNRPSSCDAPGCMGRGEFLACAIWKSKHRFPANPEAYLNLVHIDDAAEIVCQVAKATPLSQLYVVSDGAPVPRREFYQHLAEIKNLPPPTFAPPVANSDDRRARSV